MSAKNNEIMQRYKKNITISNLTISSASLQKNVKLRKSKTIK
jgi:hypothetical protein